MATAFRTVRRVGACAAGDVAVGACKRGNVGGAWSFGTENVGRLRTGRRSAGSVVAVVGDGCRSNAPIGPRYGSAKPKSPSAASQ